MRKLLALTILLSVFGSSPVEALVLTKVRVTAGPLGVKRKQTKFLPGDVIYLAFDIEDIQLDANGFVAYQTTMQIFNEDGKEVFKQQTPPQKILLLGGAHLPSSAFAFLGTEQPPGDYKIKITVNDLLAKQEKHFFYEFGVLPEAFGFVQPSTPRIGFAGTDFAVGFALVGMKRSEDKLPNVTIAIQLIDGLGKKVLPQALSFNLKSLHNPPASDLTDKDVIPVSVPLFLSRPGDFTIQVEATDEEGKRRVETSFPLTVLDPAKFAGK